MDAAGSHVAGAGGQVRSPGSNPPERPGDAAVDGHGAHGLRVLARRTCAHHGPRPPESQSETLVVPYFMNTRRERSV